MADVTAVELRDAAGDTLVGQLTAPGLNRRPAEAAPDGLVHRELHFIVPRLAAGDSLDLTATVTPEATSQQDVFAWHDTPGEYAELRFGQRPVLRYMYAALDESSPARREETYKVYHHLFDPAGEQVVTKGPGGLYTHHRGLFYGFNRISYGDGKQADVWHCRGKAHQLHRDFVASEAGPVVGRHQVAIDWHGQDGEVFAHELRELTVYNIDGRQLVEFASRLTTAGSPIRLDGDPQHAGFQFRASNEVAEETKEQTYYVRPDGVGKPGKYRNWPQDSNHADLPWHAMSFVLGGQRYTAVYLDRPNNPKEARYSERDYGRFGSYFEYDLEGDDALAVNYRLLLIPGELEPKEIGLLSADFVEPVRATVP